MPPPDDSLSLEDLTTVMSAAAIRSGDMLALDRIADLPASDRALHATVVLSKSASADTVIARVLTTTNAVSTMRNEIMRRRATQ